MGKFLKKYKCENVDRWNGEICKLIMEFMPIAVSYESGKERVGEKEFATINADINKALEDHKLKIRSKIGENIASRIDSSINKKSAIKTSLQVLWLSCRMAIVRDF